MARILVAITMMVLVQGGVARAQEAVVVELYTSQGCSSCPPADALFARLADRPDLIPLALHVDYWDYLGWDDAFADPAFTKRQKGYASAHGARTIYTPQMIISGQVAVVGHKPMELEQAIAAVRSQPTEVLLAVQRMGESIEIAITPLIEIDEEFLVQLVRYIPTQTVMIERGENAGNTFDYRNVVTEWQTIGRWDGHTRGEFEYPATGDAPAVVLVQRERYGRIVAAALAR